MHWAKTYLASDFRRLKLICSNHTDVVVYLFLCHRGRHTTTVSQIRDEIEQSIGVSKKDNTIRLSIGRLLSSGVIRRRRIGRGIIEVWVAPSSLVGDSRDSDSPVRGPLRGPDKSPQGTPEVPSGDSRGPLRGPSFTNPKRVSLQKANPYSYSNINNKHKASSVSSHEEQEQGSGLRGAKAPGPFTGDRQPAGPDGPSGSLDDEKKLSKKEVQAWIATAIDTISAHTNHGEGINADPSKHAKRCQELREQVKRLEKGRKRTDEGSADSQKDTPRDEGS